MKTVLITGVNGVIGSTVASVLYYDGYNVIGTSIEADNNTGIPLQYFQTDITDKSSMDRLPKDIDVIVHCAAVISYDNDSNILIDANCKGVQNIATFANRTTCSQVVYFSSLPVIGVPRIIPVTEEHPINPPTVYHITKYFGEQLLSVSLERAKVVTFRIPSPVGRKTPANKIVPTFVKNAIEGRDFILKGTGGRIQNYIDVRDIASAVRCAIEKGASGVFNIASERSYSNRELAELCISLFHSSSRIKFEGADPEESNRWIVSTEKAKREMGFTAGYSLEDTLRDIATNFEN